MITIITMITVMTIRGQDFERSEIMPNMDQCWRMAAERMEALSHAHGEDQVDKIGVGCIRSKGDPA